ncbi:MAG: archaellin/type IV pilin N-terminal domain-containing protein [Candidatus Woesearchaeota archaeon]
MNKKADMGIGTLIIFIAMILVAAIAAGVLIQTATSLQNRALLTGDRTRGQVSTGMSTLLLYAMNGTNGTVNDFRQKVQLSPGSDPVTLETALLSFDTDRLSGDYVYTNETCEYDDTGTGTGYHFNESDDDGTFAVRYLVEGPNHQDGYLVRGDIVELCYRAPEDIEEDTRLRLSFNPQRGTPLTIDTSTPNIMTSERVYIFP